MSTKPTVLIVGAGEFGASTAVSLLKTGNYGNVTVVDRAPVLPAMDAASCDINKVVRFDYYDRDYCDLAKAAIDEWNKDEWKGIYHQPGVCIRWNDDGSYDANYSKKVFENVKEKIPSVSLISTRDQFVPHLAPNNATIPVTDPASNALGYFNPYGGWANAAGAVEKLYKDLLALGGTLEAGVDFEELLFTEGGKDVRGIRTKAGKEYTADKVIVALGSWTAAHPALSGLLPKGLLTATGQVVAAVQLSPEDAKRYADIPVSMHYDGSAFYMFPPNKDGLLKFAFHAAGFTSESGVPRTATDPEAVQWTEENKKGWIPKASLAGLRHQLDVVYPELAKMPIAYSRMCWYSDVVDGDWVIDYSKQYPSLMFATGGAGHAFKFLPIIGNLIRSRFENTLEPHLVQKWRASRESAAEDPARAGMQRKPLDLNEFVGEAELGGVTA
ncbi:hypothetical protein L198_01823 [Cryptococcus wingfieldii CBS 7118]|uniref:FAD dependent oxidoreductase domain-containing protein n=1 Tax=Cryptococcus wingfieldii CBS 7118 TaxID=1295528 RepID=A0A1E3JWB5_9TREE|nr:hypothetical protein L198_01823 [Cryptococcus wingfieldii CBS 7118]ODO05135.1 hypothetical protein L198_01823 [Cryptococcus wingfieldii CBS 7118]